MRILTWNAFGGDSTALANVLVAKQIDLCVLQEAKMEGSDPWYAPLEGLAGYTLGPTVPENEARDLPGGHTLYPAEGVIRAYAIVWRNATVSKPGVELVNYVTDDHWGPTTPSQPTEAAAEGYDQRPPLEINLHFNGQLMFVFTWHAPLKQWNHPCLEMFEESATLARALRDQAVIAGDLNTTSLHGQFAKFAHLQQPDSKLDYVLANTKPNKLDQIPGVALRAGSHWALAAQATW